MNTPVYNMLTQYSRSGPVPFHMPGHLLGRGLKGFLKEAGKLDITEIPGSDCLHNPEGAIMQAQDLAAGLFGAGKSYFLVNGSTVGLHAMIRAAVKPGGKILIGRDSHRSVMNAVTLIGADPVYVMPEYDIKLDLALGYNAGSIKKALAENPGVEAVLLTRPNYYGIAAKLEPVTEITRSSGIPLLIDEAHGAHFMFHDSLPEPSLVSGADSCVQSLHKTLPALTQTALLHIGRNSLMDTTAVQEHLSMLQTTSPSYILMASIDIAREVMQRKGKELYGTLYEKIGRFNGELEKISGVKRISVSGKNFDTDFSRIVLSFEESGISGFDAETSLRRSSGVYCEMAGLNHIVLIATPYHTESDFGRLIKGIKALTRNNGKKSRQNIGTPYPSGLPEKRFIPGVALNMEKELVSLDQAEGMTAGGQITPYPPGIPLVCPGEAISGDLIEYASEILDSGGNVHGIIDRKLWVVR